MNAMPYLLFVSGIIYVILSVQVGIFRKSGVKSRIAKLREVIEESTQGDTLDTYDLQQAYDVADMLKQYFRELPDSLLTTKMSDTFVAIFQRKCISILPCCVHVTLVDSTTKSIYMICACIMHIYVQIECIAPTHSFISNSAMHCLNEIV